MEVKWRDLNDNYSVLGRDCSHRCRYAAVGYAGEVVVNVLEKDVEDYYYLKMYEGSEGRIVKVLPSLQYEILFARSNRIGIFRQRELRKSE